MAIWYEAIMPSQAGTPIQPSDLQKGFQTLFRCPNAPDGLLNGIALRIVTVDSCAPIEFDDRIPHRVVVPEIAQAAPGADVCDWPRLDEL